MNIFYKNFNTIEKSFARLTIHCSLILLFFLFSGSGTNAQEYSIDTDYPGGNVIVANANITSTKYFDLDADTVFLRPDLRDTPRFWFYWNFRISGAENRTLVFKFPGNFIGAFGPAYSTDGGESWKWLYSKMNKNASSFEYKFKNGEDILFSQGIPYLESNFSEFISQFKDNKYLKIESLATSKKGRNIEKVLIQHPDKKPKHRVLLTARHHACEAMANYTLEGIIKAILVSDDKSSKWLNENVAFFIVPFVDKDGVEDGDQGKNRRPYDPLGDYSGESIYNGTAAIREQVPAWAEDNLNVVLDLHCPGLRGKWAETIFMVGAEEEKIAKEQILFHEILMNENVGKLKLHPEKSFIEFGVGWNKSSGKKEKLGCREWGNLQKGNTFSATLEIAYANNNGQMVTPENARLFGEDIASAISKYLLNVEK